ncbi:glycosyltransferase [Enorma phocaeensis]|uniref:glycosyltransferase n=1 Tax=Enorma phocaeensis TaxID=1871019 RepID=UPI0032097DB8
MSDSLPHMVFFTDGYPYGSGEKSFVSPELEVLTTSYQVTLVAFTSKEVVAQTDYISALPPQVERITYVRPAYSGAGALSYLPHALMFFFSRIGWRELRDLWRDGFTLPRLIDSIKQYAVAGHFRDFCSKQGLFNNSPSTIYYSFWFSAQVLALAMEKRCSKNMSVASRIHGYDLYNERNLHARQPFQRTLRDACDKIFFAAESSQEYFSSAFGDECKVGQYVLNRLGVSRQIDRFEFNRREALGYETPFTLISCSSVIPLKRVELISRALESLSDCNIRWVHFGDGPLRNTVEQMSLESGIRAEFAGALPNEQILACYKKHRYGCFILVSETEGCPVCVQEALAFGMPIIITDAGGASETFRDNGYLLSQNPSSEEVAMAIRSVYEASYEQWTAWSEASFRLWEERFDLERNKQQLVQALSDIAAA